MTWLSPASPAATKACAAFSMPTRHPPASASGDSGLSRRRASRARRPGADAPCEHGCGATWLTGTYDPEARLLYWPTGNPCPDYNGEERKGDNLYTASVLALEPATGKLRWYYQFTPHDLHDWDADRDAGAGRRAVPRPAAKADAARATVTGSSMFSTDSPARCFWPSRSSRS